MSQKHKFVDKFFKDKNSKVAILSFPNLPLSLWAIATILSKIVSRGAWHDIFNALAFGSLLYWAVLEITQGASYFRRLLGLLVLVFTLYNHLN